jgi:hypothetical protein
MLTVTWGHIVSINYAQKLGRLDGLRIDLDQWDATSSKHRTSLEVSAVPLTGLIQSAA